MRFPMKKQTTALLPFRICPIPGGGARKMKDVLGHGPTAPLRLVARIKTGTWEHQPVPSAPGSASSGLENTARKALPSAKCLQVLPGVPRRGDPWLSISHASGCAWSLSSVTFRNKESI